MDVDFSPYTPEALKYLNRFNRSKDHILVWLNAFDYVTVLLKVNNEELAPLFLDMIKPYPYEQLLYDVKDPLKVPYGKLLSWFTQRFSWRCGRSVAIYRFFNRVQMPYETVPQYVAALKKLIVKCYFRNTEKAVLFKKFSIGIESEKAKERIREEIEIKDKSEKAYKEYFERALAIALEIENEEMLDKY